MSGVEERLRSHLNEQARAVQPIEQGVEYVMNEGRRKRAGRLIVIGVASAAALTGLVVGSIALLGDKDPDAIVPAVEPLTLGLPTATAGSANFDWQVLSSATSSNMLGNATWTTSMSSNGLTSYTFGTVPVPDGQPRQQALYATADGVDPVVVGAPFDPWISDLDSTDGAIYAIGTVPQGTSYAYQAGVTIDEATTWAKTTLPLDLDTIREELGGVTTAGAQVVSGNGVVVAVVQTAANANSLTVDGVDAPFGSRVGADGVEVFGEPSDLDAIAERECPPGWALAQGQPRPFGDGALGDDAVATTTVIFPGGDANSWRCESPDGESPDLWIDPARVHGDVVQVVPYDALGLSDASVKALRQSVRLFTSTDGANWTERAIDAGGSLSTRPSLLWTGSRFALRAPGADGSDLWLSDDGATWTGATLPDATDMLAIGSLPNGSLLLTGRKAGELVAFTSADGAAWTGVLLQPLLQLKSSWRVSQMQLVTGPEGASLIVQTTEDVVAKLGAPVIDHGRLSLRLTDSQGMVELLEDGEVIDRLDSWTDRIGPSVNGMLSVTDDGTIVVADPTSGERIDAFVGSDIQLAMQAVWNSEAGQRFQNTPQPIDWWVLDTVDGTSWGLTALDLGGGNVWLGALGESTPAGHVYRFGINGGTAVVLGRPQ